MTLCYITTFLKDFFLFVCLCVSTTCVQVLRKTEGRLASDRLELEFQTSVSHPSGHWEGNPGPLREQSMLLTTELFLQLHIRTGFIQVHIAY